MEALGLTYSTATVSRIGEVEAAVAAASEACVSGNIETTRSCVDVAAQLVQELEQRTQIELRNISSLK